MTVGHRDSVRGLNKPTTLDVTFCSEAAGSSGPKQASVVRHQRSMVQAACSLDVIDMQCSHRMLNTHKYCFLA